MRLLEFVLAWQFGRVVTPCVRVNFQVHNVCTYLGELRPMSLSIRQLLSFVLLELVEFVILSW